MVFSILVACGSCGQFQVLQEVKHARKHFRCKVCNEKNSVRRIYGRSAKAKDMRMLCQKLSKKNGAMDEARVGLMEENQDAGERSDQQEEEMEQEANKIVGDIRVGDSETKASLFLADTENDSEQSIWDAFASAPLPETVENEEEQVVINGKRMRVTTIVPDEKRTRKRKKETQNLQFDC